MNTYAVIIERTEAGKIFLEADDKDEALEKVYMDIDNYLDIDSEIHHIQVAVLEPNEQLTDASWTTI